MVAIMLVMCLVLVLAPHHGSMGHRDPAAAEIPALDDSARIQAR